MPDSSRQRFLDSCAGVRPETPFLWESGFWAGAVERWHREGLPEDADPFEFLGLERFAGISNNYLPIPRFQATAIVDEGDSELVTYESGEVRRRFKSASNPANPDERGGQILQWPVRDRASWGSFKRRLDPLSPDRPQWLEDYASNAHRTPRDGSGFSGSFDPVIGCPAALYVMCPTYWLIGDLAGFEGTAILHYDDPELIRDIYEFCTGFVEDQLRLIFGCRVPDAVFLNEEAAIKSGPFMSPAMYRRVALPWLARIADVCRHAGVPNVFVHSSGDIRQLVPMWLETGVNGFIPIDVSSNMDPVALRREYGDGLVLIGGIDRRVLERDRADIAREVAAKAPVLYASGRSIPSGDAHFPIVQVSLDNMRFYVDALRKAWEVAQ